MAAEIPKKDRRATVALVIGGDIRNTAPGIRGSDEQPRGRKCAALETQNAQAVADYAGVKRTRERHNELTRVACWACAASGRAKSM